MGKQNLKKSSSNGRTNETTAICSADVKKDRVVRSGIRASVWLPDFVFRLKGRRDALRGQEICASYIRKLNSRCSALEAGEHVRLEKRLYAVRKAADRLSQEIASCKEKLSKLPETVPEDDIEGIRYNRSIRQQRQQIEEELSRSCKQLAAYEARIRCQCGLLDKRLERMRSMTASKIRAYEVGMRERENGLPARPVRFLRGRSKARGIRPEA